MRHGFAAVAVVVMIAALGAVPETTDAAAPVAATPKPTAVPHHVTSAHLRPQNQHLHRRVKERPRVAARGRRAIHSRVIGGRTVVRHATGTITGTVHGADGYPITGASVHLTRPRGRRFRNRHARHPTTTNAEGEFTMHGVRPGPYRVIAIHRGHGRGRAQTRVHAHATATVSIGIK